MYIWWKSWLVNLVSFFHLCHLITTLWIGSVKKSQWKTHAFLLERWLSWKKTGKFLYAAISIDWVIKLAAFFQSKLPRNHCWNKTPTFRENQPGESVAACGAQSASWSFRSVTDECQKLGSPSISGIPKMEVSERTWFQAILRPGFSLTYSFYRWVPPL